MNFSSSAGGQVAASDCGGIALFGGFQRFGTGASIQRTIKLKPHYKLKIKLMFAKVNAWDGELGILRLDGAELWKRSFQHHEGPWNNICGSGWRELFYRVEADVAHTGDQATVVVTSTLNEPPVKESWGIRDFFVFYAACSPNCGKCTGPLPKDCTQCLNDWVMENGNCAPLANLVVLESSFWEDKFTSLNGWVLTKNMDGNKIHDCNGKTIVGGFASLGAGATASKKYSLPLHNRLRFIMTIYKIDSWNNEWLVIKFDGVEVWKRQYNIQTGGVNFCGLGGPNNELIEQVDEIVFHSEPQLEILITSTLDKTAADESWGFREFKLFYEPKEECAIFYTECDFKGAAFDFCAKSPNFQKDNFPPLIRSIKVPPQAKITLYESTDYNGKKVTYTTSQNCINSFDFSLAQLSGHIDQEERWLEVPKNKLRGNM